MSIRDGNKHITVEWLALIIIFLCMIICCILFRRIICSAEIEEGRMYQIINLKPLKWISSEYLLSYVIPLIAFDFTKWQDMAKFLVLWGFLFYLCLRYWQMPVAWLGVIGYYATECKLNTLDGQTIYKTIISKKPLVQMQGDSIFLNDIDNEHMIQTMNIFKKEDYN